MKHMLSYQSLTFVLVDGRIQTSTCNTLKIKFHNCYQTLNWGYMYIIEWMLAKGHRIALMDEPPQKRNKGLVSYDAGDSDEDEDIIRSPQAHTHFQPNSPQLPVIFHRSPPSPTVHHNSPDKIEYTFQASSGPSLRQPPPQRIIVSQGNQVNQQRIAISVEQAERIGLSVSQGVAMSPPRGEPIAAAQGIPQKAPPSVQQSLLGEGPRYNRQQPFWMSPH